MDIVALGELLIDFTEEGTGEFGFPVLSAHPGGAPANFLAAATKFGAECAFIGKVGDDAFGRKLAVTMAFLGVSTEGLIKDPNLFTTLAFVTLSPNGERDFSFARKPGADTGLKKDEVNTALIDKTKIFHFGTLSLTDEPSREATKFAVDYAKRKGKLISFDPNYRAPLWRSADAAKEAMLWGLSQADVVKISDNEIELLFGVTAPEGAGIIVSNYGAKLVAATMGPDGAFLMSGHNRALIPAPYVEPVDTTGAGDICGGAIAAKLVTSGIDLDALRSGFRPLTAAELNEIGTFAVTEASLSTEKKGGILSNPVGKDLT